MGAPFVAAAAIRAERQIVDHLRDVGATSPDRAVPLPEMRFVGQRRLARLVAAQVVREDRRGYWLDEPMYAGYRSDRRGLLLLILGIAATIALAVWISERL